MEDKLIQEVIRQHYMSGIGRLMKGVAHNMNGPLQVLSIQVELLKKIMAEGGGILADLGALSFSGEGGKLLKDLESKQEICVKKIGQLEEELERLHGMTDFIVNRCGASEENNTSMVDLNEVIKDEVILLHADLFFKHKVRKTLKLKESLPLIPARYPDLSQALNHILQNAIEAIIDAEEREIIVETGLNGGNVFVSVQDTGCGIPPSAKEKLFTPFYTTKLHPHPGLGLFLARKILEPLRAKFKVESEPGMTRVAVFFPYKKKEKM
ncbi:MAG: ATP-binding protein [Thermodesulfobacteriota bacterium]|nr:ATP-binding protein [Thermodesulfobacteriota bacterium]